MGVMVAVVFTPITVPRVAGQQDGLESERSPTAHLAVEGGLPGEGRGSVPPLARPSPLKQGKDFLASPTHPLCMHPDLGRASPRGPHPFPAGARPQLPRLRSRGTFSSPLSFRPVGEGEGAGEGERQENERRLARWRPRLGTGPGGCGQAGRGRAAPRPLIPPCEARPEPRFSSPRMRRCLSERARRLTAMFTAPQSQHRKPRPTSRESRGSPGGRALAECDWLRSSRGSAKSLPAAAESGGLTGAPRREQCPGKERAAGVTMAGAASASALRLLLPCPRQLGFTPSLPTGAEEEGNALIGIRDSGVPRGCDMLVFAGA